ncbi:MAG: N-6 DNA methylase, partial [Anaerolineae bacterium]
MKKPEAKREVARLVEKLNSLTKREFKKYDEENTKKDFILPLFRALGWAVEDRREVTAEDKVSRRRVDYAFRIEGIPKLFLEAKPLKADLDNPEYAWQAINYAWTKGVTWAVLTDFEGLKVFNAEWKERDLRRNIVKDIRYEEYVDRFDELWLLSREAMKKGLLDREAEKWGKISKKRPVGEQLFEDLIKWRWELRRHLEPYNRDYSKAEIDEAVQRILDRLIFIRTAEDRELEPQRLLLSLVREWEEAGGKDDLIRRLNKLFRDFDEGYDSRLFERHFCEKLDCEPLPFVKTIRGLYQTPDTITEYDFNAIDADVLGGIYEQYLGYAQGLAEEEAAAKKMRRKKRGIYYTPKFVVRYIVENTVGRLLQERSHDQIRKLRILDPACGSGSFLIEAFDALDEYHESVASGFSLTGNRRPEGRRYEEEGFFDFARRLQILKENIYGVDLDPQAVEIAQLNLLLKTLHRRELLPNLDPNIRCGNSLISGLPIELSQYFGADWEEE